MAQYHVDAYEDSRVDNLRDALRSFESFVDPISPVSPSFIARIRSVALVPNYAEVSDTLPLIPLARPASLTHQANHCFSLGPTLFSRDVWEVGCAISFRMICERYTKPMSADFP